MEVSTTLINIKEEMRRNGMTMAEMADLLDMSSNTFSWKLNERRGREFNLSELAKIAELFGKTIDYLVEKRISSSDTDQDSA